VSASLKAKTAGSLQWSAAETLVRQGMQFGFAIILARLLTPHDFGIMALMVVFVGISNALVEGGFGAALVQRANPSREEVSAVFFFNIAMSVVVGVVLAMSATWVARFFNEPVLQAVTYVAAINVFVTSLGMVQLALLIKSLNFRAYFFVTVISSVLGGVLAVLMAWQGYGVWSLVGQSLAIGGVSTVLLWYCVAWRPIMVFRWAGLAPMWRFGSAVMVSGVLETLVGRLSSVVIGRAYAMADLGLFSRAESTRDMASTLVSRTVTRVAFPVLSAAAGNPQLARNALRKILRMVMYFNLPAMAALAMLAPQLIPLVYGPQWAASVPFLQILALAGLLAPMCLVNLEYLKSTGKATLYFRVEMVKKMLVVIAIAATFSISIAAIAWGQVAAMVLFLLFVAGWAGKALDYGLLAQLADLRVPAAATAGMVVAIAVTAAATPLGGPALLLAQFFLGAAAHFGVCYLARCEIQQELLDHVMALLRKRLGWP
jgi:teichuronic acid exporter